MTINNALTGKHCLQTNMFHNYKSLIMTLKKVFSNVMVLKEAEFDLETENVHHTSYIITHAITHIHSHAELHPQLQSQTRACMP